jgi:hypothetical protein
MRRLAVVLAVSVPLVMPTPTVVAGPVSPAPVIEYSSPVEPVWHRKWHRPRHCHRSVRRHWVRGYGNVAHRHVGRWCRLQIVRRGHNRGDCVWIGGVRICF